MKTKNNNLSKKIALILVATLSSQITFAQGTFKSSINQALNDYLVPVIVLVIIVGVVFGLVQNWEEINNPQTRKKGLISAGMILLYALLFMGAIAAVVSFASGLSIQI